MSDATGCPKTSALCHTACVILQIDAAAAVVGMESLPKFLLFNASASSLPASHAQTGDTSNSNDSHGNGTGSDSGVTLHSDLPTVSIMQSPASTFSVPDADPREV